jgi:GTPase SAR1 family protein
MISGPSGSGKTSLLVELIKKSDTVATPPPVEIVYCYAVWQKAYEELEGLVRFHRGLLGEENQLPNDGRNRWLIIDDLMREATEKGGSDNLFTRESHHHNITVFLVVQNLFHDKARTVSRNTHYFFLGKNPRYAQQIMTLASQMMPGQSKYFMEAFQDATKEPYSFLLVSARQETPDHLRLVKNFARDGKTMYAYAPKK